MTNKEIIDGLKFTVDMFLFDASTGEVLAKPRNDMDKITVDACREAIKALEQQKTGHWIDIYKGTTKTVIACRCSVCGKSPKRADKTRCCPNCGAKMQEE